MAVTAARAAELAGEAFSASAAGVGGGVFMVGLAIGTSIIGAVTTSGAGSLAGASTTWGKTAATASRSGAGAGAGAATTGSLGPAG